MMVLKITLKNNTGNPLLHDICPDDISVYFGDINLAEHQKHQYIALPVEEVIQVIKLAHPSFQEQNYVFQ
jgi:hypothetical protein